MNKKSANNRFAGRPGVFDTADDLQSFYIRQTKVRGDGELMTIRVEAIENEHYWRGWRHGVNRKMHPPITWKKGEWELAPTPSPTAPAAEGKIPDPVPRKKRRAVAKPPPVTVEEPKNDNPNPVLTPPAS